MALAKIGKGPADRVLYVAKVEPMRIAYLPDGTPFISLAYPSELRRGMLAIAKEMEHLRLQPTVNIWENDIAIVFQCKPITLEFIQRLWPNPPFWMTSALTLDTEVCATAEAEFDTGLVKNFELRIKKEKHFLVYIVGDDGFSPLWSIDMSSYSPEKPFASRHNVMGATGS